MPVLDKIVIKDFRNIVFQELSFSPNVNCISGNNGEGKTNLMDAIYYLSMTKSAFSSSDRFNFRFSTHDFAIVGTYSMPNGLTSQFSVEVKDDGTKKIRRDSKLYGKISDHIGVLPIVMVSPSDISLVTESGDQTRKFVNAVLSQMDKTYLSNIQQYNRLLLQRNSMLKEKNFDEELLRVFDAKMETFGRPIYEAREKFVQKLNPIVSEHYAMLSSEKEDVIIKYKSDFQKGSLADTLQSVREKDSVLGYTTAGLQRDEFNFLMNGHPLRRCGSQGQQKSFLVSLKFAQYAIMKENYGFAPIMLLDDVFDKLDMNRISNLLSMVAGSDFGQIFITDSNKVRMQTVVDNFTTDRAYFECVSGEFKNLQYE